MSCGSLPLIPICSWISEADPAVGLSGRARETGAAALRLHRQPVWIRWRSNKKYRPSLIGNLIG